MPTFLRLRSVLCTLLLCLAPALLATALRAEDDPAPFPDMAIEVGKVLDDDYYDQKRFLPRIMVERALRALEQAEMSIEATWTGDVIVLDIADTPKLKVPAPDPKTLDDAMAILEAVRSRIDASSFTPARARELDYVMVNGALACLDPHTVLFPPEPAKEFTEEIHGEFYGIGAYLVQDDGIIAIERVMPGLPADRAGVEDGDIILRIDSERTAGLSLEQAVHRIKGPKGSTVHLTLERKSTTKAIELPVVRDLVQVISTRSYRSGDVGYVRMDDFSSNTTHELYGEITKLQAAGPLRGFVLDLRFNGGGLLDAAKWISQFFLPKRREIVRTVTADGVPDISRSAGNPILDVPMMVMVSGGSASAAEILSGALQENDRAVIIGTTTFGKGSVQTVKDMQDGSKLKFTIQEYQLPGGVSIQDVGITPDVNMVCHELLKSGDVELIPYTREREVDDEFALKNTSRYQHSSTYDLGWVAPYLTKDELKRFSISAHDFLPDQEGAIVISLLQAAISQPGFEAGAAQAKAQDHQRQFLLDQLKEPIAKRAELEEAALAAALVKLTPPVTWGGPSAPVVGAVSVTYTGPAIVHAGAKEELSFKIHNDTNSELGRLYGVVSADKYSPLWEDELIIGAVPAGKDVQSNLTFHVPPRLYEGEERFTLDIYADGTPTPISTLPVSVQVLGEPRGKPPGAVTAVEQALRPHFSYSWKIAEPSGDGKLVPGEAATVTLGLKNDGDAASSKIKLYVYKSDDPYVQLGEVRFVIDPIQPGQEVTCQVPITVLKEVMREGKPAAFTGDSVKLQIRAEEAFDEEKDGDDAGISGIYRASMYSTLTLPVNQPVKGGTVIQPLVSMESFQLLPSHQLDLRVRISDGEDALRFVALFQDEDKVDLQPGPKLAHPADKGQDGRTYSIYHAVVTLKPGLNNLRIVAANKDEVTDILPLRIWGPPGAAAPPVVPLSASNPPAPSQPAIP